MSNYTKSTNFAAKDSLPSGNANKVVKGTEINTEFDNIATAIATKADLNSPTLVTPNLGTPSAAVLTNATGLPLTTGVTGTLPVANGGTGATTFSAGALLKGAGTSAITTATAGTDYAPATSGTSILKGNGTGGFSNAASGTDYAPATSGTAILKGNGTGGFSNAAAGTDYAAATTGTSAQLLANNGSGGFSNVTVGSGLSLSAGTLSTTGGASISAGDSNVTVSDTGSNGTVTVQTDGTERMRIDSSGNVGIGVTPPTVSQGRLLSLAYSGSGISVTSGTSLDLTDNAYYNTAWKYGQNGLSARFQLTDDQFIFFNAATGTAGNNITWSERMRIDASGNVGIGETSPGTRLDVKGNGVPLTINSANSNGNKVQFEDNGTVKGYFGTTSFSGVVDCCFQASDSSGNTRFSVVAASGTIGLNTQPATTGTGITFPATQSASSDANTLDDYEEGTWTPSIGGNATYGGDTGGRYVKVGKVVTVWGKIQITTKGTGSATTISGLPFTSANLGLESSGSTTYYANLAVNVITPQAVVPAAATTVQFYSATSAGTGSGGTLSIFGDSSRIYFTVTYETST